MTWSALVGWDSSDAAYSVYADPGSTTNLIVSDDNSIYFSNNSGATFTTKYTAPSDKSGGLASSLCIHSTGANTNSPPIVDCLGQ